MISLDKLKEVVRASNPKLIVMEIKISEKEFAQIANGTDSFDYTKYLVYPDITIGDVLLAIDKKSTVTKNGIFLDTFGRFWEIRNNKGVNKMKIKASWNLLHNLDWHAENKPETIKFLEDLLL